MYRYKQKRARKKREAETSLFSLALYNAQRSYSTKLSLGTLSIWERDVFVKDRKPLDKERRGK